MNNKNLTDCKTRRSDASSFEASTLLLKRLIIEKVEGYIFLFGVILFPRTILHDDGQAIRKGFN